MYYAKKGNYHKIKLIKIYWTLDLSFKMNDNNTAVYEFEQKNGNTCVFPFLILNCSVLLYNSHSKPSLVSLIVTPFLVSSSRILSDVAKSLFFLASKRMFKIKSIKSPVNCVSFDPLF